MILEKNGIKIRIPNNSTLMKISDIDTTGRIRENYGDIEGLAETFKTLGLMQPIDVSLQNKLEDGGRRIKAFEFLGFDEIPFVIFDVEDLLAAEFIANAQRKNFTIRETATIIDRIEKIKVLGRPEKGSKLLPLQEGKTVDTVAKITGQSSGQIIKIKKIADAAKENPDFERYLEDADKGKKSVNTVHKLVTIKERNSPKVEPPVGLYDMLAIDPPWEFENATIRGSAAGHYDTIPLEELCDMELPLTENAVVFLWVPNSLKYDDKGVEDNNRSTIQVLLEAWNLTPKTEFIWYKENPAPGHYSLTHHETLLLCFRGKPVVPVKRFRSVLSGKVGEHSEKPIEFYQMMREMYPGRKAIEMFARVPNKGFEPWGNEVKQ